MTETPGRQALVAFLESDRQRSQRWLARLLKVGQSCVSLWVRGRCKPDYVHILALSRVAGIPEESWLTEEDRQKLTQISVEAHKIAQARPPVAVVQAQTQEAAS
jgi:plasmid maintenance system antidote protein VapI